MSYTVWSRGRLLGESELDYACTMPKHRMGDFHPTPLGDTLMPVATGAGRAYHDRARFAARARSNHNGSATDALSFTTEYADAAAAMVHQESLDLELRGPDGCVIATEHVSIQDTDLLIALTADVEIPDPVLPMDDDPDRADVERELALRDEEFEFDDVLDPLVDARGWDADGLFPRYQVYVILEHDGQDP